MDYEYRPVHLVKEGGQQFSADFQKLNPKGEVPLYLDGSITLSQSMAIIQYIDQKFSGAKLFPEKDNYFKCLELCELINSGIQPIQNLAVTKYLQSEFHMEQSQTVKWMAHWIHRGFIALEKKLQSKAGGFCMGDTISAADLFLVPQVYNANRFKIDMEEFPIIKKINDHCIEIDAFKKAAPEAQPDYE